MIIDFNQIKEISMPGMNNGTGTMSVRMFNNENYRVIMTKLQPNSSIGIHAQETGDDINYIISGKGKAVCDGLEEELQADIIHICPKGSEHSIINTGNEDLVFLTIVVNK